MHEITLDFESYYSQEYSLRKMTPVEYILDERWECTGCAVIDSKINHGKPVFLSGERLKKYFVWLRDRQRAGEKIVVTSHNALFDMCVLAWRYGLVPDQMIDTQGMARAVLFAFIGYSSLDKVAQYLGIAAKGDTIKSVKGMTAADIQAAGLWDKYTAYACHDAYLCQQIYLQLKDCLPAIEYEIMDMVLRCAVVPRFRADTEMLAIHAHAVRQEKEELLRRCGFTSRIDLMSNEKFALALQWLGVTPPRKISPTTGEETWAFAKTDMEFVELEDHPDPQVQALMAARFGNKSTQEETRTARFQAVANMTWPGKMGQGWMPIALRYGGAHTHRLSGEWGMNMQNLRRTDPKARSPQEDRHGRLRYSLVAPEGYTVVTADLAQVEARVTACLAGQDDLVQDFANGADIYSKFSQENIYNYPVSKGTPQERFVGKQSILGLGFGMGAPKFDKTVKVSSYKEFGSVVDLGMPMCTKVVGAYRARYRKIPQLWDTCKQYLPIMANGGGGHIGPCEVESEAIVLPNGMRLFYHNMEQQPGAFGLGWTCVYGRKKKWLHGGKVTENIVQALARIIVMEAAVRVQKKFPRIPLAHQAHDELIYVVRDDLVDEFTECLVQEMTVRPWWMPDLPLKAEAGRGKSYGAAK